MNEFRYAVVKPIFEKGGCLLPVKMLSKNTVKFKPDESVFFDFEMASVSHLCGTSREVIAELIPSQDANSIHGFTGKIRVNTYEIEVKNKFFIGTCISITENATKRSAAFDRIAFLHKLDLFEGIFFDYDSVQQTLTIRYLEKFLHLAQVLGPILLVHQMESGNLPGAI